MFRFHLLLSIIMVSLSAASPCLAQQDTIPPARFIIKLSPQHLFVNGFVFEVEKSISQDGRHSLLVSPRFFRGATTFADDWSTREIRPHNNAKVTGYGMDIKRRLYFRNNASDLPGRPYIAYGISYHHFKIGFDEASWIEVKGDDDLFYYQYKIMPFQEKINRWGTSAVIGLQGPFISDTVIADMYVGLGYSYSHINTDYTSVRYNTNPLDYGHTGLSPIVGAKFGIVF